MSSQRYRQEVTAFRQKLNQIVAAGKPAIGERLFINKTGHRTLSQPFKSQEQRMAQYARRRFESVCRIMAVFEVLREAEHLDTRNHRVRVETSGAVWQAFQGTETMNACHTCPSHLQLDGQLPTLMTLNRGLQRRIVVEFADCMLMPRSVNEVDIALDELSGKEVFSRAAVLLLNEKGMDWDQGARLYKEELLATLGDVRNVISSQKEFRFDDPNTELRLDMLCAYYDGFFEKIETIPINNLIVQIEAEMHQP